MRHETSNEYLINVSFRLRAGYKPNNKMSNPRMHIKPISILDENSKHVEYGTVVAMEFETDTVELVFGANGKEIDMVYDTKDLGESAIIDKEFDMFS